MPGSTSIRIPLKAKISTLLILVPLLVALWIGAIYITDQFDKIKRYEKTITDETLHDAEALAYVVLPHLIENNYVFMSKLVSHARGRGARDYVLITDNKNRIVMHNDPLKMGKIFTISNPDEVRRADEGVILKYHESGKEVIDLSYPVKAGDLILGTVRIGLNTNWLQEEKDRTRQTIFTFSIAAAVLVLAGIFLALRIANTITRPIFHLRKEAEKIGRGDYDSFVSINRNDEIGELAASFNRMAGDLKSSRAQLVKKAYVDSIIANMNDALIVISPDGLIKTINKAALHLLGYAEDELLTRPCNVLFAEQKALPLGEPAFADLIGKSCILNEEITFLSKEGGKIPVLLSSSVMSDNKGNILGIVCVAKDITERKQVEKERIRFTEELKQNKAVLEKTNKELENAYQELQAAQSRIVQQEKMASIGQLAAGVAHEINNPMGFISSNLSSLGKYVNALTDFIHAQSEAMESHNSREAAEVVREKRKQLKLDFIMSDIKELIKDSRDGVERVSEIVRNLKSFSRVDEAECQNADINECIENTISIIWNEIKYKATLTKKYGKLLYIKCHPRQLNQVFMNLLINAAQAIEKQGEITIETTQENGFIKISITDTGCGIPEEIRGSIFNPFFTTKEIGKGTGLGLSIAYEIVKKHHGEITVESEVGKGTTFTVSLPVVE